MSGDHNQNQKPTGKDSLQVEVMKLALDALEDATTHNDSAEKWRRHLTAMDALRQAIEQAETQEPVAWMTNSEQETTAEYLYRHMQTLIHDTPLYTAPPQREWVGLTDEEVIEWVESGEYNVITNDWASHIEFARAIEAKLKEKNHVS